LPRLAGLGGRMPEVVDRDAEARQIRTLLHDRRQILPGHHEPHQSSTLGASPPPLTVALQLDETLGAPARHMLVRARRGDIACRVHTDHRLFRSTPLSQFGARSSPQRRRSTRSAGSRSGWTPPPPAVALQLAETLAPPARHMLARARRGDLACRVHPDHRLFRSTPLPQFGARSSPQRRRSTRPAGSRSGCTPPASRADTDAVMRWRVAPRSPAYAAAAAAASGEVWSIPTSEIASMTAPAASRDRQSGVAGHS